MTGLLIVRPDTRPPVGLGHLARSLGIAAAWQLAGGQVRILVDPDHLGCIDPRAREMVASSGLPPAELATTEPAAGIDSVVRSTSPDWILLDGYEFPVDQQRRVRSLGRLLVVDDQASLGHYDADLVLDQNVLLPGTAHHGVGPGKVLHGVAYVCLRPDALAAGSLSEKGVIALLAGGDPKPPTRQIMRTLLDLAPFNRAASSVRLVAMPWASELQGPTIEHRPFAAPLHRNLDGVSVAVAPAGSTAWELSALGIPSVLFATAANQEAVGLAVSAAGAAFFAGSTSEFDPEALADRIAAALVLVNEDPERRASMSTSGRALVDGRGSARVVAEMRSAQLELRPVSWSDVDLLFEWASDPVVRSMAFSSAPISRADHEAWLRVRLDEGNGLHWIASLDGQPIGQVRFDVVDKAHEISISLAEGARGRRLASPLIIAASRALTSSEGRDIAIYAQVKNSNRASLAAFATARYGVVGYRNGRAPTGAIGQPEPGASAEGNSVVQLRWLADVSLR